ncbi:hypothetical protein [Halomonas sp. 11-S5]|uniref:hypothetical protein n=1 Tax=Halomonas sp. 11-S5 TaxID=2994064 RepID=UPI0024682BF6|nr:hypothetical protein [Halomonas sp. 11-S5]
MQRRECLALLAGMASLPLGLSGCSLRDDLTFGLHPWPGYEPLFLSRGFGWLPDGITLQRGANAGESLGGVASRRPGQVVRSLWPLGSGTVVPGVTCA